MPAGETGAGFFEMSQTNFAQHTSTQIILMRRHV